jgi:hypothetical protein
MRPTILVRMVIGYLAIFIPVVAVSIYAFSQEWATVKKIGNSPRRLRLRNAAQTYNFLTFKTF